MLCVLCVGVSGWVGGLDVVKQPQAFRVHVTSSSASPDSPACPKQKAAHKGASQNWVQHQHHHDKEHISYCRQLARIHLA